MANWIGGSNDSDDKHGTNDPDVILLFDGLEDQAWGEGGNDTIAGGLGFDRLFGGPSDDILFAGDLYDYQGRSDSTNTNALYGDAGDDTLISSRGPGDYLVGGTGDDVFQINSGSPAYRDPLDPGHLVYGGADVDTLDFQYIPDAGITVSLSMRLGWFGGDMYSYSRSLVEFSSIENVTGSLQDDVISGNSVANKLAGLAGDDVISGGAGDDTITGGKGYDTLRGGADRDIFVYDSAGDEPEQIYLWFEESDPFDPFDTFRIHSYMITGGPDTIEDFEGPGAAQGDLIDLRAIDGNTQLDGQQSFVFAAGNGPGHVWIETAWEDTTIVLANTDDDTTIELAIFIDDGAVQHTEYTGADFWL